MGCSRIAPTGQGATTYRLEGRVRPKTYPCKHEPARRSVARGRILIRGYPHNMMPVRGPAHTTPHNCVGAGLKPAQSANRPNYVPPFSQFTEPHPEDLMISALFQDEVGAFPGGGAVLAQVHAVDLGPDFGRHLFGFLRGEVDVAVEVGGLVFEHGVPQRQEPLREPLLDCASSASTYIEKSKKSETNRGGAFLGWPFPACRTFRPSTISTSGCLTCSFSPGSMS